MVGRHSSLHTAIGHGEFDQRPASLVCYLFGVGIRSNQLFGVPVTSLYSYYPKPVLLHQYTSTSPTPTSPVPNTDHGIVVPNYCCLELNMDLWCTKRSGLLIFNVPPKSGGETWNLKTFYILPKEFCQNSRNHNRTKFCQNLFRSETYRVNNSAILFVT